MAVESAVCEASEPKVLESAVCVASEHSVVALESAIRVVSEQKQGPRVWWLLNRQSARPPNKKSLNRPSAWLLNNNNSDLVALESAVWVASEQKALESAVCVAFEQNKLGFCGS